METSARGSNRSRLKDILIRSPSVVKQSTHDAARFLTEVIQAAATVPLPPFTTIASLAREAIITAATVQVSMPLRRL